MKIAYVITRSDPVGGAQVHVRDLAVTLTRDGHVVTVLTGGTGRLTEELSENGVSWLTVPHLQLPINPFADMLALGHLSSALKRLQPDLVSAHSSKAGVLARLAARSLGLPVIFTAHGWSFTPGVPRRTAAVYRWVERSVAPLADRIITVSDFDRTLAIQERVTAVDRITTVHNGMPDVDPALRANPARSPVRLIMVARFEQQKDHRTLLESLAGITDLPWHLDLVGEGPLLPAVRSLSEQLGLSGRIQFWGARRDVAHRLADAQVFLLITNWEGFPRSVLEAMRAGLPVVSSDVGGVSESVEPGRTGFLVPRGDAGELQKRLRQLLTDAELRMRLGQEGRRQYEARFQFDRTTARTMSIYRDVLSRWGRSESGSPQIFSSTRKREGVAARVSDGESAGD